MIKSAIKLLDFTLASFRNIYMSLMIVIARSTEKELARQVSYLKVKAWTRDWDEFLKRNAKTMWQCDLFSKKIVSKAGLRDIFVLVFLHVETRRVFITESTYNPDEAWIIEQAEAFIQHTKTEQLLCKIVMHDNDGKYSKPFLEIFSNARIKPHRTAIRSPNTVAFVERFVQTIKKECLDHFVVFGHKHMDVLCSEFNDHYHLERPHQGLENETLIKATTKGERTSKKAKPSDTIRLSSYKRLNAK